MEQEQLAARVERLADEALALAVARYGRDHPEAADHARSWAGERSDWLGREAEEFAEEVDRLGAVRDDLARAVDAAGEDVAGPLRPQLLRVRLTLGAARSGTFTTASGPLADFLTDVGASFEQMELE